MNARCDQWAARAVHYRREGELRKAERAEERAFYYLRRMKLLMDRSLSDGAGFARRTGPTGRI